MSNKICPILYLVIPCYNEEEVLPRTIPMFEEQMNKMINSGLIREDSQIVLVDDGSFDDTWNIISEAANCNDMITGLKLSTNCGHQNALLAGLMYAKDWCDISISIDCDGQDDISVMSEMVAAYKEGNEVVYGVRDDRESDTGFKRWTAETYYRLLEKMDTKVIYNHADYRLLSKRVLKYLSQYQETNLFLRGLIPTIGFKSTKVFDKRTERIAGETHYPLMKMIALAVTGITNMSIKPIYCIIGLGAILFGIGIFGTLVGAFLGNSLQFGINLMILLSGLQILCIGAVGIYVGKGYLETKHRLRYIIEETTEEEMNL